MWRLNTIEPLLLILALLLLPMPSNAEERSDWRQPLPQTAEIPEALAKMDTSAGGNFSATDAQAYMEQAGYDAITQLEAVNPFVWRAIGNKDGASFALTADYTGAVVGIDAP